MKIKPTPVPPLKLGVVMAPLDQIKPDAANARRHSRQQVRAIARSIEAFGFNMPVLIDAAGTLIAGHGRVDAAKLLGMTEVPAISISHLSKAQIQAFAVADNRLTDLSDWDERLLATTLKSLANLDLTFDLEATGFTMAEIDLKIESLEIGSAEDSDPDEQPVPGGPSVCKNGDLWLLGDHRVLCGDALDPELYKSLLSDELVQAMFADMPYNVPIDGHVCGRSKAGPKYREFASAVGEMSEPQFIAFMRRACELAAAHSTDGAVHFACMDWRHIHSLLTAGDSVYDKLLNICVWTKNNGGMGTLYRSAHEFVAVFRKGGGSHRNNVQLGKFGRNRTNVWSYPGANTFLRSSEEADLLAQHPTPKPVAMVADALLDVTSRRDLVLDGFLGSGSTLIACERIGRRCRGIELDPLYVDLTIRRWQRVTGEKAVLASTGESFDSLAVRLEDGR